MSTILCSVPTARFSKLPSCLLGIQRAASIGGCAIRVSAGINAGSLDTSPDTTDLLSAIEAAYTAGHRTIQLLLGYSPTNCGAIRYLPEEQFWAGIAVEWSVFIEAAHKRCVFLGIELIIEYVNEWDGKIGGAFDTVKNAFVWQTLGLPAGSVPYQAFRYLAFLMANVQTFGRKICVHQIGGGGAAQKATANSWRFRNGTTKKNDAAEAIVQAIAKSGGFFAYNTYPNCISPYNRTPKALAERFNGYTVANTGAVHVGSVMGSVPWKLGETQVPRGKVADSALPRFRQYFYDSIKAAGRSYCAFDVVSDDAYGLYDSSGATLPEGSEPIRL